MPRPGRRFALPLASTQAWTDARARRAHRQDREE